MKESLVIMPDKPRKEIEETWNSHVSTLTKRLLPAVIAYLLNHVYTHLDKPASTVRGRIFDFSSAFNTIQPALLGDKLTAM